MFCPVGTQCPYLHAAPPNARHSPPKQAYYPPPPQSNDSFSYSNSNNQVMNPMVANTGNANNYKTKKCRHYQLGKCKLGTLCNFAHGDLDVRDSKNPDSFTLSNNNLSSQGVSESTGTYDKILLLENRMDATFTTQRMLLAKLKQLFQSGQAGPGFNIQRQVL